MSLAYYNEIDPKAAAWLRELMAAGVIASGLVDERSILDVKPGDLDGFTQCHFFAGIGVWSYALRLAGWPDDRPVWTGSCPCQPFSQAGRGDGFADERHLWPYWHYLIATRRPPVVFGEQVASKDGLAWLDVVHADLEATGYAPRAADLCAAGVGAPHIRQRLWIVAADVLADADGRGPARLTWSGGRADEVRAAGGGGAVDVLGHAERPGRESGLEDDVPRAGRRREGRLAVESGGVVAGGLADDDGSRRELGSATWVHADWQPGHDAAGRSSAHPGPTNGHWAECEWVYCRDDKYRPLEPGVAALAHGSAARMGRLRGYGNAIVAQVAQAWIEACEEAGLTR